MLMEAVMEKRGGKLILIVGGVWKKRNNFAKGLTLANWVGLRVRIKGN